MRLDLEVAVTLVTLDEHQIDRREAAQKVFQCRLLLVAQFMHQRPTVATCQKNFRRPGDAVPIAVLAFLIHVEAVMRMLQRRDANSAPDEFGHQTLHQPGLARILPTDHAPDLHVPSRIVRAFSRSSGVFTLKKGSKPSDGKSA